MGENKHLGGSGGGRCQGPRAAAAPEGHHSPSKAWDGPKTLYNAINRDRGQAHPQSAPWQGLTPLWSRGAPTLCLLGFCILLIQPHMEQRYLQELEKQTNPQQALQPFLPLFFPLLPSSLASLPSPDGHSCFRHMAEASMGVCTAWDKDQVFTGREPALLSSCFAAQGREAKLQGTWQGVGTSIRM